MNSDLLKPVSDTLNNDYILGVLFIIAFSYANLSAPEMPDWFYNFFSNDLMKVLFLSLLLFVRFDTRPTVAIIIAVVFVYMYYLVNLRDQIEEFRHSTLRSYSNLEEENTILDLNPIVY